MRVSKEELQEAFLQVMNEEAEQLLENCEKKGMEEQIEEAKRRTDWTELYERGQQRRKKHSYGRWTKVAACFFFALFVAASAYAVKRVYQEQVQWKTDMGENEDRFQFEADNPVETPMQEEKEDSPVRIERRYHPQYVAGGFEECGESQKEKSYRITYQKKEANIYYDQLIKNGKTTANLGLTGRKTIDINGYEGEIGCKGGKTVLRFVTGQYVFRISADEGVEWEELIQMAKSVSKMPPDKIETYYEPVYLPEKYNLVEKETVQEDWMYQTVYRSDSTHDLVFFQTVLQGATSIDSENMNRKDVLVHNWKGRLNYGKKKKTLVWATNEYAFVVSAYGKISEQELVRIAESVAEKK